MNRTLSAPRSSAVHDAVLSINPLLTYCSLCVAYLLIGLAVKHLVLTEEVVFNSLSLSMNQNQIAETLAFQSRFNWLTYVYVPCVVALQAFFPAICLNIRALYDEAGTQVLSFRELLKISMNASIVFLYYPLFLLLLARFNGNINYVDDFNQLDVFSLRGLLPTDVQSQWWSLPLRSFNVFEVLFWLTLVVTLQHRMRVTFKAAFGYLLSSYGIGLALWMLIVAFVALSKS